MADGTSTPVKLYGWAVSPFVARALLSLEEAGIDYEHVPMNPDAGDHRRPEHLARNPFGQVPVLEDGDLTLFESRAIARHVLRKHKPELLGVGDLERSAAVDVVHVTRTVVDENVGKLRAVLEVYEARLGSHRYLAGHNVSLADLNHFTLMHYFMSTEYGPALVGPLLRVKEWWEELSTRPAARKVATFMPLDFGADKNEK
ncbi:hypothetical protein EJB05_33908, partial [Eragrostis curvula]